jgi:cytochrome c-type biogenesis protein CcmH
MWWLYLGFALILGCLSLIVLGREFRQTLATGRPAYIVTLFCVPLISLGIYYLVGANQDVRIYDRMQQLLAQSAGGEEPSAEQRDALMESIRRRAEQIDSVDYWFLIANQHMGEGNYDQAVESFERASEIAPEDTAIKAELAQAMFLAAGNRLTPEVQEVITEVRALNPENVTINGLLGIAAFQVEQWQMAVNYWELAMAGLPPASREAQAIASSIEAARTMLGEESVDQEESSVAIQVAVSLDPSVEVDPQTTVFVFARASEGPAMPLAVKRLTVADLPTQVSLSDADAMMASMRLSGYSRVDVVARISFGGTPTASSGDYEILAENIQPENNPELSLVIRNQLP